MQLEGGRPGQREGGRLAPPRGHGSWGSGLWPEGAEVTVSGRENEAGRTGLREDGSHSGRVPQSSCSGPRAQPLPGLHETAGHGHSGLKSPLPRLMYLNCLLIGRKAMTNVDSVLKSRDITLLTKVHLVKAMVFPVVMY